MYCGVFRHDDFCVNNDLGLHGVSDQAVFLRGLQGTSCPGLHDLSLAGIASDSDYGMEIEPGKDLGAVQLNQFCTHGAALGGNQVELESLCRPNEHQHHACVRRGHEGIFRRQHAGVALRVGRSGELHFRAVAQGEVAPVFPRPFHVRVIHLRLSA